VIQNVRPGENAANAEEFRERGTRREYGVQRQWKSTPSPVGANNRSLHSGIAAWKELSAVAISMTIWKDAPADFFLSADVTLDADATFSLLIRGNPRSQPPRHATPNLLEDYYALTLDAHANVVTLKRPDVWNRMPALRTHWLDLPSARPVKLHVMLHGDILEAFVDDRISLTSRVQLSGGALAVLARDGNASLENVRITQLP
jgi:hypothetical protein